MFEPKTLRHFQHHLDFMVKAAGDQDPEALADLAAMLQKAADQGIREAAAKQREQQGWSWARYGKAFGITAWAAQKKLDIKMGKEAK